MKEKISKLWSKNWVQFTGRTLFYFLVLMLLIYLYHYRNIQGGTFIYNEF
ncbi:teichoic acid D-Ala incorporation-associated protein DltX [Enterococcus camelliae]|uniref:Teichoic acid D-Ala incorporation-associated protein DltX n=1 Tax=Enterococcus camelliae TaxID=453959 RepID=A0ABW5TIG5_9ENTE